MASDIRVFLGKDTNGKSVFINLVNAPHVLIAGTTGSGKSSIMHFMLTTSMSRMSPQNLEIFIGDPKLVEFAGYEGSPHVKMVANTPAEHEDMLRHLCEIMDDRYAWMRERRIKNAKDSYLSNIIVAIDEFGDLVMHPRAGKKIVESIIRLTQLGRAAGITCVIATQNPIVKTLNSSIKSSCPTRMLFKVSSSTNSRVVIDTKGGEKLRGNGHMLLMDPYRDGLIQVQTPFISEEKLQNQFDYIKRTFGRNRVRRTA